jgi:NAD(P)H-hydrate epimerase
MGEADQATIAAGTPGFTLMLRAGRGVATLIRRRFRAMAVLVACGPGNNGGDGFVIADDLRRHGWPVTVAVLGDREALHGDAADAWRLWGGPSVSLTTDVLETADLLVDALFGAGLTRAIEGEAAAFLEQAKTRASHGKLHVVAIDVPSGVDGDTGLVRGIACPAELTATFFRRKPGHLLRPGRDLCGDVRVIDIGIEPNRLDAMEPVARVIGPALWSGEVTSPGPGDHKYTRGHVLVIAGEMAGAARLSALSARKAGTGLVTTLGPAESINLLAADAPGMIVSTLPEPDALSEFVTRRKVAAIVIGPGLGSAGFAYVEAVLSTGVPIVLDADGISGFAGDAGNLTGLIKGPVVLTPHAGEFARLVPELASRDNGRLAMVGEAARRLRAVVLLKGPDTVICGLDGPALILDGAPSVLATGGSGDVLAGLIGALMGQGMKPELAAASGAWIHAEAARIASFNGTRPILAEDLCTNLPEMMGRLWRD